MIIIPPVLFCNSFAVFRLAINPLEKASQDNKAACLFELELAFRIPFLHCLILNLPTQPCLFGQAIFLLSGVFSVPGSMLWALGFFWILFLCFLGFCLSFFFFLNYFWLVCGVFYVCVFVVVLFCLLGVFCLFCFPSP